MPCTKAQQLVASSQINARTVTVGDYTVHVRGLGDKNQHTRAELAEFFSHYGEVASACSIKNLGALLDAEKAISRLRLKQRELAAIVAEGGAAPGAAGVFGFVYRLMFLGGAAPNQAALAKIEAALDQKYNEVGVQVGS